MKRLLIATLLTCLMLVGCGSSENEVVENTSEVVEDDTTLECETIEETITIENESETIEDTSIAESENTEEPTSSEEKVVSNSNEDNGETESPSRDESIPNVPIFDDGTKDDIDWNQYSSGNGDDLSFSGSLTLPSGLTISTLNKFNASGMATGDGNSWMGDIYSDIVAQNYETMANNFDAFNATYNSAINVANGEQIWWRATLADSSPSLELRKCDDHYKIIIRGPLLDNATAQVMGWTGMDAAGEAEAREALVVLLSTITPNCVEVKDAIIASLYTAPNGQEPIDVNGGWTKIGGCQIKVDLDNCSNSKSIWTFQIKP